MKTVIYNLATGEPREVDSIDARELLATGRWSTVLPLIKEKSFDEQLIDGAELDNGFNAAKDRIGILENTLQDRNVERTRMQEELSAYQEREAAYKASEAVKDEAIRALEEELAASKKASTTVKATTK